MNDDDHCLHCHPYRSVRSVGVPWDAACWLLLGCCLLAVGQCLPHPCILPRDETRPCASLPLSQEQVCGSTYVISRSYETESIFRRRVESLHHCPKRGSTRPPIPSAGPEAHRTGACSSRRSRFDGASWCYVYVSLGPRKMGTSIMCIRHLGYGATEFSAGTNAPHGVTYRSVRFLEVEYIFRALFYFVFCI